MCHEKEKVGMLNMLGINTSKSININTYYVKYQYLHEVVSTLAFSCKFDNDFIEGGPNKII